VAAFDMPGDLTYNRGLIEEPAAFAQAADAASWLYMCGDDFASVPGGMSYGDVQEAVPASAQIVSDRPDSMTMDLAREHVATLDELPRPTVVTCRTGPRSSAVVYLYAGLRAGASADDVIARAEEDGAPFVQSDLLKTWVSQGLAELS
jgi:hypothetical protein